MTPDINVLVAASRADHVHHRAARRWLKGALGASATGTRLDILPMVGAGFLRLVTNERVFPDPTPIEKAVDFLDALLSSPGVEIVSLGAEWTEFHRLVLEKNLMGNAIPDAWIAAAVRSSGRHLVTFDRGFRKLLSKRELTVLLPDE